MITTFQIDANATFRMNVSIDTTLASSLACPWKDSTDKQNR